MSRADLFTAAKRQLGLRRDGQLAERLGLSKGHLCNIKYGVRALSDRLKIRLGTVTTFTAQQIDDLINLEPDHGSLPLLPNLFSPLRHEPGMLPSPVSGDDPSAAPAGAAQADRAAGGQGTVARDRGAGEPGASPETRRLIEGGIYYPREPDGSRSSHRRIVGFVGNKVAYSSGGNRNFLCEASTFKRWARRG